MQAQIKESAAARIIGGVAATLLAWFLSAGMAHAGRSAQPPENGVEGFIGPIVSALESAVFFEVTLFGAPITVIVVWMFVPMLFFTIYLKFMNLRGWRLAWNIIRGKYRNDSDPGEVTQFQALSTALSGTVGLGNIAGVAVAIALGGPGAAFWMVVIGFFAMSLKFAEVTMAVKYREFHAGGTVGGGPPYYLSRGLAALGRPQLGMILGVTYAIFALPAIAQLVQVNQAYSQFSFVTGIEAPISFGIGLAALVAVVIIGGIREIASVTSKLVPSMIVIYISAALFIIFTNAGQIPAAIATIFTSAFNPEAVAGGILGVIVIGMKRAVYSSEAGIGTATFAHSAAKTREPASEGIMGLIEPFIDTVIVCTMTALVIVITGAYLLRGPDGEVLNDIAITSAAFKSELTFFPYVLALAVFLFAYSTIVSWAYYIERVFTFLFSDTRISRNIFRLIYCAFLIPAPAMSVETVFAFLDSVFFLMAIPNIIGLYFLAPTIKNELEGYLRRLKSGEIKMVDTADAPAPERSGA